MEDQYGSDFITIADEDGTEFELEVLSTLEYNGERYSVIRAYKAKDLTCELTVTKLKTSVSDSDTLASGISGEG